MNTVLQDRKAIFLFIGPAMILYLLILLIPTFWSIGYSFFEGSPIRGFEFVGISNYLEVFSDRNFKNSLGLSIKYAALVTTGQVVLGLALALLFVFYLKKASFLVRTLVFFPVILPAVAVAEMFSKLFEFSPQLGLINSLLASLSLDMLVQPWLAQGDTAFAVLVIMDIWKSMGFYAVILFAGLIDIPEDVLEAAKLDGAKGLTLVYNIVLPMIRPILISAVIFSLNGTLKVFETAVALTGGGPGNSTTMLTMYMYDTSFTYSQYGYGSTIAVYLLLLCLGVTLLVYRFARKDVA
ncbi:carbohydrate ABC transporter permease [Halalkalibacter akibai]|uniref:Sugar ABC transporter permease n=1 Tax=Halalkalibacter akibai (strain ATCC 43226 / DSM 21942 / CIP 109018 / JCM 9157 / 1139) TaxID=1236973 RepID=W4QXG5_HALA3|nr:sugar ABC transporter permease [Halalkalibacter akibai]GAE36004.1 sugar ABC transporter permease [Halalkalibacter akibai JCM 9157]